MEGAAGYDVGWGFTLATLVAAVPRISLAEALSPLSDPTVTAQWQWRRGTPWLFVCCAMRCGQRSTVAVYRRVRDAIRARIAAELLAPSA